MGGRGAYLRVGLLIAAGFAGVVGLVLFLGGDRVKQGKPYETYFSESVTGLEVGAPVKYRGVTIGRVTNIGLVNAEYGADQPAHMTPATYRLVFVRYVVDEAKVGPVTTSTEAVASGLRARLASQGITGLTYIELDFVNARLYPVEALPWQPRVDYIPSMPSTLSQVQDAAQQLLAKLNGIDIEGLVTNVNGMIGDLRGELKSGDVHQVLAQSDLLVKLLQDQVNRADLPGLVADLRSTTASVRTAVQGRDTKALIANAAQAAEKLSAASARLPALIAALQSTVQRADNGTADLTASLAPVLRDAQAAAADLRETTSALRDYPAGVLLGGPPPRRVGDGK